MLKINDELYKKTLDRVYTRKDEVDLMVGLFQRKIAKMMKQEDKAKDYFIQTKNMIYHCSF